MADSRNSPTVAPVSDAVQEQIHYDSLWSTALEALTLYAGQRWTALGDADPGITLMQAFTYGVSDVSYRHTLPLVDLLSADADTDTKAATGERLDHRSGIFATEFGPELALTSSPVTLEDYRRGLLDLTVDVDGEPRFCFRDVQIALLAGEANYSYLYDEDKYAFNFAASTVSGACQVQGAYRLWVTLNPGVTRAAIYERVLVPWLKAHRNLCEWEIEDVHFVEVQSLSREIHLVLDDDLTPEEINPAVAGAIWAINQALLPSPVRQKAVERLAAGETAEQVYNGPQLKHGWISQLAPVRETSDGKLQTYALPVPALSAAVASVTGISAVEWVGNTDVTVTEDKQRQLWVTETGGTLQAGFLNKIKIYKRGQDIAASANEEEIRAAYNKLNASLYHATSDDTRGVPYGRDRHPGFYRSVGSSLPSVYGLQQGAEVFNPADTGDKNAQNLLLFLRTFEQLLANSAAQLRALPHLLAFDGRDVNARVWGASIWPQASDEPLAFEQTAALLSENIRGNLSAQTLIQSLDPKKELAILDYLLRYFGEMRAARASGQQLGDPADFVAIQQGFLRQVTRLAYDRAAISISKVSALQRKIAARLGVGKALFAEALQHPNSQFPQETLPFYLIEHQELLPKAPPGSGSSDDFLAAQTVTQPKLDSASPPTTLTLTLTGSQFKVGQLVDFQGKKLNVANEPLMANIIHAVSGESVTFLLSENDRLLRSLPLLQSADYKWLWRVSKVWLKPIQHDLIFTTQPKATDSTATLSVDVAFPVGLKKGDRFALRPDERWDYQPTKARLISSKALPDIVVEVLDTDPLKATVKVKWIAATDPIMTPESVPPQVSAVKLTVASDNKPAWPITTEDSLSPYGWSVPVDTETFAFTLSVVLDHKLLASGNPAELNQWIETIVREEMPGHLNLQLHWVDDLGSFARQYQLWQNSGRPVGDQSYGLLRMLGLGERPVDIRSGIGFVRVASKEDSTKYETEVSKVASGVEKENLLLSHGNIYVRM